MNSHPPEYLSPAQVVARWNNAVTIGTLANWRAARPKKGPPFVKMGSRVRYPLDQLVAYEKANQVQTGRAHNDNTDTKTEAA